MFIKTWTIGHFSVAEVVVEGVDPYRHWCQGHCDPSLTQAQESELVAHDL